jgi:hypothetical protein
MAEEATMPEGNMAAMSEDSDPYSDGETKNSDDKESKTDGDDASETVIPRSICAGHDLKVGDEIRLEITGIHDKEYSVKYAPEKDDSDDVSHGTKDKPAPTVEDSGGNADYD